MNSLAALLASLGLLLPSSTAMVPDADTRLTPREQAANEAAPSPEWLPLQPASAVPVAGQVRIERRVTIRIAPRSPVVRQSLFAQNYPSVEPSRFIERKIGDCVPVSQIVGVQPDRMDRLLLFMRDQRIISASLEKACRARDFYSGFYVERTGDGRLCVDRDKLHSRAGATCQVSQIRQLVAVDR